MFKKMTISFVIASLVATGATTTINANQVDAHSNVVSYGDESGPVWDLQSRLQQLGLYKGKVDGDFGPLTLNAVKTFQRNYGLAVDGVAGSQTWSALYRQTFTKNQIEMMAKMVHGEARGESYKGKVAVAAVILNRVESDKFPNTVKGVLFEPRAFTAVSDGQYYTTPGKESYQAVYDAIAGWDPSYGALFYFNPETATSDWIWSRPQITQIGDHIFTK